MMEADKGRMEVLCKTLDNCLSKHSEKNSIETVAPCSCAKSLENIRLMIRSIAYAPLQTMVWNSPCCINPILACMTDIYDLAPIGDLSHATSTLIISIDSSTSTWSSMKGELDSSSSPKTEPTDSVTNDGPTKTASDDVSTCTGRAGHVLSSRVDKVINEDLANNWVMCIANLVAGNTDCLCRLCSQLSYDNMVSILLQSPDRVAQKWCAVLLPVLQDQQRLISFCCAVSVRGVVARLCQLYVSDGPHACFALYCLELVMCHQQDANRLVECWEQLSLVHRLLVLSVVDEVMKAGARHKRQVTASPAVIAMTVSAYQDEVGRILSNNEQQLAKCQPQVVRELVATLLTASTSETLRRELQRKDNLLFLSLCFLKALNLATFASEPVDGNSSKNSAQVWTRKNLLTSQEQDREQQQDADSHDPDKMDSGLGDVSTGLRCDLVQLIGNLVHQCKSNQDKLRRHGGLEEIFCSCRRDHSNPLIQEAVIFTLGCCMRDNLENVQHLKTQLQVDGKSDRDCPIMNRLGLVPDQYVQVPSQQ